MIDSIDPTKAAFYTNPAIYALIAGGAAGFLLLTSALSRGSVTTAVAGMVVGETVGPALVGVAWLGDQTRAGLGWMVVAGFVIAVFATLALSRFGEAPRTCRVVNGLRQQSLSCCQSFWRPESTVGSCRPRRRLPGGGLHTSCAFNQYARIVQRRIMGIETEFGVTCTFHGHRRLSPDEVARYLFRRVVSWGRSSNVFLRNGARLYLDVGSHPEYATAECDSLIQLVTHDRAGERVLEDLLIDAEQRLADEGIGGDIYLFKNNTDSAGNSYGCHENYLIVRAGEFSRISDVLLPFLVTRQLICGAGKVLQTPKAATFCLSQRAEHIWEGVSSATTRSRPIINTRDEPHADAEKYRRLHVIVGDSNMCEYHHHAQGGHGVIGAGNDRSRRGVPGLLAR